MPKKGGRPKLENPRSVHLGFRANKDEAQKIHDQAKARGISPGEFCRLAALGKKIPSGTVPEINRQTWAELSRIGNNLNQVARHLNQGSGNSDLAPVLDDVLSQVRKIQLEIIEAGK